MANGKRLHLYNVEESLWQRLVLCNLCEKLPRMLTVLLPLPPLSYTPGRCAVPVQRSALLCQLDCVDQPNLGLEGRQQCYERCVTPVAQMQALLDAELRRIQVRLKAHIPAGIRRLPANSNRFSLFP